MTFALKGGRGEEVDNIIVLLTSVMAGVGDMEKSIPFFEGVVEKYTLLVLKGLNNCL